MRLFLGRPSLLVALGGAFERARARLAMEDPPLAMKPKDKPNMHITLAGESRNRGPYVVVMLSELASALETS